jgi:hypothetical protein
MPYAVDFSTVSTVGLESSPVAEALAGLRANEARYFKNKYDHVFTVEPASDATTAIDWVHRILRKERDIVISSRPLEATAFQVENIRIAYVFYERPVGQRDVQRRRSHEAGGRVQALRTDGSPRGTRLAVQVREAEVEAGRNHSRFLLRLQERVLNQNIPLTTRLSRLCREVFPGQADDADFFGGRLVRARCLKPGGDEDAAELGPARRRRSACCLLSFSSMLHLAA